MTPPFGAGYEAYPAAATPVADRAPRFGLYVHVPFCPYKCPYCDFNVYVGIEETAPAYFDAVLGEAVWWQRAHGRLPRAGSLFAGGGTPSMVEPGLLARTVTRIGEVIPLDDDAEVTVEANPETVDSEGLTVLREAGVNRISIGAQSFRSHVLSSLGRGHSAAETRRAVAAARRAGFGNVSLDLIYGGPGESLDDWRTSLAAALELEPDHLSCYALTIEEGTAFARDVAAGRIPPPHDDEQAAKLDVALDTLGAAGFGHYEISNWARPGFESRHNLIYWTQGEYVGLGAGAHSHLRGVRSWNRRHPRAYAADPGAAREGEERLDEAARAEEWLQLRLRLVEGVPLAEAAGRLGRDLRPAAEALLGAGLVTVEGDLLALTRRGFLLENEVALRLGAPADVRAGGA